jgi:polyisoprenoid-binding protein YceI
MIKYLFVSAFSLLALAAGAQDKFFTKTGRVAFYSKAPLEDIEATTKTASALLDTKTGALQFSVLMKGFEFEKALMQEHFNESYVESEKYPRAEFKGTIVNNGEINYSKDGSYPARVKGKMTLHGVTRDVETTGTIRVSGGKVETSSVFNLLLSDYKVKIPPMTKDKIANSIRITVDARMEPLKGS